MDLPTHKHIFIRLGWPIKISKVRLGWPIKISKVRLGWPIKIFKVRLGWPTIFLKVWLNKLAECIQLQLINYGTMKFLRQS